MNKLLLSLIILITVLTTHAVATEIEVVQSSDANRILVKQIPLPDQLLEKELKSGLPNNISLLVRFYRARGLVSQARVNYSVIYDLWDEVFIVEEMIPPKLSRKRYKTKQALITALNNIDITAIYPADKTESKESLVVTIQTIYNPVDKERIKRVQEWIRTTNGYGQLADGSTAVDKNKIPPNHSGNGLRFEKLFDKIIDDYIPEEGFSAQWKSEIISLPLQQARKKTTN